MYGGLTGACIQRYDDDNTIYYTHGSAVTAHTPVWKAGLGWLIPVKSLDASVEGAYKRRGIFGFAVANGVTVAVGTDVYYNETTARIQTSDPGAGHLIGTCLQAGTGDSNGTVLVNIALNRFEDVTGNFGSEDVVTEGVVISKALATTINTAGSVTLTAANMLSGLLACDPNGAARTYTTPTAALLVAAIADAVADTAFDVTIKNTSDATGEWITLAAGSGCTLSPTTILIGEKETKTFKVRLTNVGSGTEAYTVYELNQGEERPVGCGLFTTVGGDATETIPVLGAVATDVAAVTVNTLGTGSRTVLAAICTTDAITVTLSGDPSNNHVLNWLVRRPR